MLVLTRRIVGTLMIGDDIVIRVSAIERNRVRIGVDAPQDVAVHREEVFQRLQDEGSTSSFIKK